MLKNIIVEAYVFSKEKHKGQKRKFFDKDYFIHPKYVARVIEQLIPQDHVSVASALLHDTIEDTDATYEELLELFGKDIADIVQELTSEDAEFERFGRDKKRMLSHKMNTMSSKAFTIKLADRYHNILFLGVDVVPIRFVVKYTKETEFILGNLDREKYEDVHLVLLEMIQEVVKNLKEEFKIDG